MVVSLPVAVTASCHAMMSAGEIASVIAVAYRRSDVVTVTIVVAGVLVMMVVVIVDGHRAVMMIPRIIVRHVVVRILPAPTVVETVIIPIGGIVVGTVIVARPPPIIAHVNA